MVLEANPSSPLPPCQLLDCDQELYKNFPLVISERWQQEVAETVFEAVNADTDKAELRKRAKNKQLGHEEGTPRLGCPKDPAAILPGQGGPLNCLLPRNEALSQEGQNCNCWAS